MSRIPIAILGATGMVGQRMIQLLQDHPWFDIAFLAASPRSAGRPYRDAAPWRLSGDIPDSVADQIVQSCDPAALPDGIRLVLSALDARAAYTIEARFRDAGCLVVTNASAFRMDPTVPLIVPEVNADHLALIDQQPGTGAIIANPNCCTIPLAMALAPLHRRWGVEALTVATWQAVSGAGYPGESAWDMIGSVHPHPGNEEDKLTEEPLKILGDINTPADFVVSARCVRVPVADGHLLGVHVRLTGAPSAEEVAAEMAGWTGGALALPSCPQPPLRLVTRRDRPATRFDVDAGGGMAVTIGRIEPCPVMGVKFYALSHNTIRGAAGAALANAELLCSRGLL
jgi:aspartate-semialdehyde dehydrogenase